MPPDPDPRTLPAWHQLTERRIIMHQPDTQTLYVVIGESGEYSGYSKWVVAAYGDRQLAETHAERATAMLAEVMHRYPQVYDIAYGDHRRIMRPCGPMAMIRMSCQKKKTHWLLMSSSISATAWTSRPCRAPSQQDLGWDVEGRWPPGQRA